MSDTFGIEALNEAIGAQDHEAFIEGAMQVVRTLADNALRGSPRELGVVVNEITEPEARIIERFSDLPKWAEALGWLRATQHLAEVFHSERLSEHPEVQVVLSDELRRSVLEAVEEQGPIAPGDINALLKGKTDKRITKSEQYKPLLELGLLEGSGTTRDRLFAITPFGRRMLRRRNEESWHSAVALLESLMEETERRFHSPANVAREVAPRFKAPRTLVKRLSKQFFDLVKRVVVRELRKLELDDQPETSPFIDSVSDRASQVSEAAAGVSVPGWQDLESEE